MLRRAKLASLWAAIVLLSLCPPLFAQQDTQNSQMEQHRSVTHPLLVNVTGCLKKNGTSGDYYVADQNGRTWELTSKKVDLSKHLFHTVSVSGHPYNRSNPQKETSNPGQQAEGNGTVTLDVTELDVLSPSCTR